MEIQDVIRQAAARYGQDPTPWLKTAQIESGNNPNNTNPRSRAAGLFQFIPSTWAKYGNGGNPLDASANADAAMRLARDNSALFSKSMGRAPTPGEVYLMHQQGAGGAMKLLQNPSAPASSLVGAQAVLQNGGRADMTGQQFADRWTSMFGASPQLPQNGPGMPAQAPRGSVPRSEWMAQGDTQPTQNGSVPTQAPQQVAQNANPMGSSISDALAQMSAQLAPPVQPKQRQPGIQFIS